MIGLVLVCGLLLHLRYTATFRFWTPLPRGEGPAGPPVGHAPFASVWSTRPVLLLGLGDSVTAGYGASPGYSYFDRLHTNPGDEFPDLAGICLSKVLPGLSWDNRSVSGSDSLQHAAEQVGPMETFPDGVFGIVVMTTGGNDIIHWYGRGSPKEGAMYGATFAEAEPWIGNFRERLDGMITGIEDAFPGGCAIFLANIYDPSDGVGDAAAAGLPRWPDLLAIHGAYNDAIADVAASRPSVYLVDIREPFLGHGVHCTQFWRPHYTPADPTYWYFDNLEDPNERGYDAIRRLFLIAMAEVLPPLLADNGEMPR